MPKTSDTCKLTVPNKNVFMLWNIDEMPPIKRLAAFLINSNDNINVVPKFSFPYLNSISTPIKPKLLVNK